MKRCLGCMEEYEEGFAVCPHCGFVEGTQPEEAIHMIPGTMLNNRFIIGKVVGFGGFGVTYLAWDTVLQHRVAIKEYLPSEFSTRIPGQTQITIFNGEKGEQYLSGMQKFVDEAKKLAKFNDAQGIVKIYDSFTENETAYIVMEYLEGETLDKILKREKTIPLEQAVQMLMPIMESLKRVHQEGIIHRDIAPDNVMVTVDGEIKLIDFGAARYATTSHSRSLTVIIKPGYSPEEQYRSRGDQGPHTDVYAVGAMLYRMVTGITPPDAFERRAFFESKKKDILEPITKYCKDIPQNIENAILNAMNVRIEDRSKDMTVLMSELTSEEPVKRVYGRIKKIDVLKWPLWAKIAVPLAACSVLVLGILFALGIIGFKSDLQNEIVIPEGMTRVPSLVNTKLEVAEDIITENILSYIIKGKEYSSTIPKDYILSQNLSPGFVTEENSIIQLVVSGGSQLKEVPSVQGNTIEEAARFMEEAGFVVRKVEVFDSVIEAGNVISQNVEGGSYIAEGSEIELTVSLGRNPQEAFEEKIVRVPEFVGKSYEEVMELAREYGFSIKVTDKRYSDAYDSNIVIEQSIARDTEISNATEIGIILSLGKEVVKVPDIKYLTEEKAVELLENSRLKYEISYANSDVVTAGLVMSQGISDTEMVAPETVVKFVVSSGSGKFAMPDVTGMAEADAKANLANKGLVVRVSYANSDGVASGNVISQDIAKGTQVTRGDTVTIVVSSGEKLYKVPDVVGKKENSAITQLEDNNFDVQVNKIYDYNVAEGLVISQSLEAGTSHRKDTGIIITVSKGKQPVNVTFDANGGKSSTDSATIYLHDVYGTLPTATRENYTFTGWYTAKTGGTVVTESTILENSNAHSLYAHWSRNTLTVTFNVNGGSCSTSTKTVNQGDKYVVPTATRTGYILAGWYTAKTGGTQVTNDTVVTLQGGQTLYARWNAISYTVTYKGNGSTSGNTANSTHTYDAAKNLAANEYAKTGYTFNGWNTKADGTGTKYDNKAGVKNLTAKSGETITLYAQWKANTYTVVYDGNGATTGSVGNSTHTYDKSIKLNTNKFKKEYNTFIGWNTKKDATGTWYVDEASVKNLTATNKGTITLYAQWKLKDPIWVNPNAIPSGEKVIQYQYTKTTTKTNNTGGDLVGFELVSKVYSGKDKLVDSGSYYYLDVDEYRQQYASYISDMDLDKRPVCGPDEYLQQNNYKRGNYAYIYHYCASSTESIGAWKHDIYDMFCANVVRDWTIQDQVLYLKDDEDGITRRTIKHADSNCSRGKTRWFAIQMWTCEWKKYAKVYNYTYKKTETITSTSEKSSSGDVTYKLEKVQYRPKY